MKKLILIGMILSLFAANGQNIYEFGVYGGGSYYQGEINTNKLFHSTDLSYGGSVRFIINPRYALRMNLFRTSLSAEDQSQVYAYQNQRNASFKTNLTEASILYEFNFFPFKTRNLDLSKSLYVTAGLSVFHSSNTNKILDLSVPFGVGYKANLTKKISISFDWVYRKTFTDQLDLLSGETFNSFDVKQNSYTRNKDWFATAGITLTYKIAFPMFKCENYAY